MRYAIKTTAKNCHIRFAPMQKQNGFNRVKYQNKTGGEGFQIVSFAVVTKNYPMNK